MPLQTFLKTSTKCELSICFKDQKPITAIPGRYRFGKKVRRYQKDACGGNK
jgi:hypothetical protein